jgi:rhomboid protease GluP
MGQQKKVEPVVSLEAPSKLQKREKKEGGALVVHGGFRLRRKKAGDDLAYKSVASSLGGCKVGILEIGRQHMVLKQRLTRAGGFLLAASSFLMVPLLAAFDNASSSLEWALAVLMMVFLAGTIVVPVSYGLWLRRFKYELKFSDIAEATVRVNELEVRAGSGSRTTDQLSSATVNTAMAVSHELVFKPKTPAMFSSLTGVLADSGITVRDVGQKEIADFMESLKAATPRVWVTYLLMAVNVLLFLAVQSGSVDGSPLISEMIKWGADFGPLTVNCDQWWRLLSNCFLHFSILHLGCNMFALFQVGRLTERLFGNWFFLVIYLGCGLTGSLVSLWFNPATVAAGASGAIFGIFGALIGYLLREGFRLPRLVTMPVLNGAVVLILSNLLIGFSDMLKHYTDQAIAGHGGGQMIDMAAHCGGLISGFILGYLGARPLEPQRRHAQLLSHNAAVLAGICAMTILLYIPVLRSNQLDVVRMKLLAGEYYRGEGVDKDVGESVMWFTKAAEQGDVEAEKAVAGAWFSGQGVPTNTVEGICWLKKLADQGEDQDLGDVEKAVAIAYYRGDGVDKDNKQAVYWLTRLANRGDSQAKALLVAIQKEEGIATAPGTGE